MRFNTFLKIRLRVTRPVPTDVLIYDRVGSQFISRALSKDIRWAIFDVRRWEINVHPAALAYLPLFLYKKIISDTPYWRQVGWRILFQMAEIKAINPKVVISFVDNSRNFNIMSRVYSNAAFMGIQNGFRGIEVADLAPHLLLPTLLCFGREVKDRYQQEKCGVSRFVIGGSLKNSLYLKTRKSPPSLKYDFCWVSQFRPARFGDTMPVLKHNSVVLLDFIQRYCQENGKTLCIACSCKERGFSFEYHFLLKNLTLPGVRLIPNDDNNFSSYKAIDQSHVTVTVNSTVGFEALARGNKVLFCNFSEDPYFDVPSGYADGPWALRDSSQSYKKFLEALRMLENMESRDWAVKSKGMGQYFVAADERTSTVEFINQEVRRMIPEN